MTELTPERLREDYFVLPANVAWNEAVERDEAHAFADAWDRDHREIERLRAERDRLRALVDTIRDGIHSALLESATAGACSTGLYMGAQGASAFGDIAVEWIEEQEALAATTDSQVNPEETRVWVDCDGDVRRCPHCLSTCEGGGYVREVMR